MKSKFSLFNLILLIAFIVVALFLFLRPVDSSGHLETHSSRFMALAIWSIFYFFLLACQGLYYLIRKAIKK